MTAADGAGKWWNGMDPQDLNGYVHTGPGYHPKDTDPYVRQFYWRVDDLINKHKPDILYFDDSINPTAPTGTATDWSITNQSYVIAANYYNKSLQWNGWQDECRPQYEACTEQCPPGVSSGLGKDDRYNYPGLSLAGGKLLRPMALLCSQPDYNELWHRHSQPQSMQ